MSKPRLLVEVRLTPVGSTLEPATPRTATPVTGIERRGSGNPEPPDPPRPERRTRSVVPGGAVSPSRAGGAATFAPSRPAAGFVRRNAALITILLLLVTINAVGFSYYVSPMGDRVRDPLHVWMKPSGYVGQSAGLIAFVLFLFLYLYPIRKRFRVLAFTGRLNRWLDVHIVAGLAVPLFGAVHAAWRFNGLIGWGYFSMLLVSLSGIVGKYLYVHIPRSKNGVALNLSEIESRRNELLGRIAEMTGLAIDEIEVSLTPRRSEAEPRGLASAIADLVSSDMARWRATRRLRRKLRHRPAVKLDRATVREVVRLARREISMTQQLRMLAATQRLFRFWHVVHRPFSITAFVAVTIHVAVVVSLGVTWLW